MNRSTEYRRHQRYAHINRKKKIIQAQNGYWHYRHEGELDKGKIHCSCPLCRHKFFDSPKFSDRRNVETDIVQLLDCGPAGEREAARIAGRTKTYRR